MTNIKESIENAFRKCDWRASEENYRLYKEPTCQKKKINEVKPSEHRHRILVIVVPLLWGKLGGNSKALLVLTIDVNERTLRPVSICW